MCYTKNNAETMSVRNERVRFDGEQSQNWTVAHVLQREYGSRIIAPIDSSENSSSRSILVMDFQDCRMGI